MLEINKNLSGEEYLEILNKAEFKLQNSDFDNRFFSIFKGELLDDKLNGTHKEETGFGTIYHLAPMTYAFEYSSEEKLLENIDLINAMKDEKEKIDLGEGYHLANKIVGYISYGDGKYYLILSYNKIYPVETKENTYLGHIICTESYLKGLSKDKLDDIYKNINNIKLSELITKIKAENLL